LLHKIFMGSYISVLSNNIGGKTTRRMLVDTAMVVGFAPLSSGDALGTLSGEPDK